MRPTCLYCARKHLGQACVLLAEAHQGYPEHLWLAIGHMAEAGDELAQDHPQLASLIRHHRKQLETNRMYQPPFLLLIRSLNRLDPKDQAFPLSCQIAARGGHST